VNSELGEIRKEPVMALKNVTEVRKQQFYEYEANVVNRRVCFLLLVLKGPD